MALSFNLNSSPQYSSSRSESAGSLASNNTESAGSLASVNTESAGSLAYVSQSGSLGGTRTDEFISSNPFTPAVDYSSFESSDSVACGSESAGSIAYGSESAGSIASSDCGGDSGSSGCDFSSFC